MKQQNAVHRTENDPKCFEISVKLYVKFVWIELLLCGSGQCITCICVCLCAHVLLSVYTRNFLLCKPDVQISFCMFTRILQNKILP